MTGGRSSWEFVRTGADYLHRRRWTYPFCQGEDVEPTDSGMGEIYRCIDNSRGSMTIHFGSWDI